MIKGITPVLTLGGVRIAMPNLPQRRYASSNIPLAELCLIDCYVVTYERAVRKLNAAIAMKLRLEGFVDKAQGRLKIDDLGHHVEVSSEVLFVQQQTPEYLDLKSRGYEPDKIAEILFSRGIYRHIIHRLD
jgi:hypothetical protein